MKAVLKWKSKGKIPLVRPKQSWIDKVEKDPVEIEIQDGEIVAQDRDRWKQVCVGSMGPLMAFKKPKKKNNNIVK